MSADGLTHLDEEGAARMVDVGAKAPTERVAVAEARVRLTPEAAAAVERGNAPKGDVIGTARIAGIQAAKRTAELIPLAHPLPLTFVDVRAEIDAGRRPGVTSDGSISDGTRQSIHNRWSISP